MGYLDYLIDRYEQGLISGEDVCDNITRLTKREEFIKDVNENRKKEKLTNKYQYVKFSKSPEEIVIGWEESEKILHFIDWIRSVLTEREWEIFSKYTLRTGTATKAAEEAGISRGELYRRLSVINHRIKQAIPYYTEQFGDLYEYLKG